MQLSFISDHAMLMFGEDTVLPHESSGAFPAALQTRWSDCASQADEAMLAGPLPTQRAVVDLLRHFQVATDDADGG
jgi:hypothetical protein